MTSYEKQEITGYLSGLRKYSEGVALYQRYGQNLRLKRQFAIDDSTTNREILFEELRKLSGLTQQEFVRLPRKAAAGKKELNGKNIQVVIFDDERSDEDFGEETSVTGSEYAETPEPIKKMIRFREKYPFLNSPDCPDVLKVLVADMFTSYDNYKQAHARLQDLPDDEAAAAVADCEKVIEEYLNNREIWEELEYYREHGKILGKVAKFREMKKEEDYSALTEIELIKKLQSANANESKQRKAVNSATEKGEHNERAEVALAKWSATKKALQEEVARRKKK